MPIIDNSNNDQEIKLKFIYHPLMEMICSLHVISDFSHHEDHKIMLGGLMDQMNAKLKKDILFFSERYYQWLFIMDLFSEMITEQDCENTENPFTILSRMEEMDLEEFAYLFLGTTLNRPETIKKWLGNPDLVQGAEDLPLFQYIAKEDVFYALSHMSKVRSLLVSVIERFWAEHFSALWLKLELGTRKEIELNKSIVGMRSVYQLLSEQEGIVVMDNVIYIPHYPHLKILLHEVKELSIVFSSFTKPHMLMHIHKPKFILYRYIPVVLQAQQAGLPLELPELLKALSDKTRLAIVMAMRDKEKTTKDLTEEMSLTASTVSQHLSVLKNAGLVDFYKDKKFIYYRLNRKKLEDTVELLKLIIG